MNTRFAVAVHVLTFLATRAGRPASSELIAGSVNAHASLIRRLLSRMNSAGLTHAQMGTGGGAVLARPAHRVTLLDVGRAMGARDGFLSLHQPPNTRCLVGRHIQGVLEHR